MIRHSAFILSLLLLPSLNAQITIGQAEMPTSSSTLVRTKAVTNPLVNYGATGAGYSWNFASLAADVTETTPYQTVASTNFVYAIVYADLFFNGNRANHAKPGTDIAFSQFLPIDDPYTFRYRSASEYKTVGYGVQLSGIPIPIIFDQHDVIYELPLTFGATSTSTSSYQIEIPNVGAYGFEQDRTNVVDGWGAITTPGGVFDVLRVKTTLNMQDDIAGFTIDRPVVREYKWLAQGLNVPVLQINTTSIFGTEVVTAIYYYDVPRTIEVAAPLATSLCPSSSFDLAYTSTGAFNAGGFFVPANHFTAQLSDATGSFANPTVIGDVTATGSGTIPVTIPANTPTGTGYRIRVISTSPDHVGTSNTFDITIGGAAVASISAEGPSLICSGSSLTLTAVGGPGYQWLLEGEEIDGATDANYDASLAGSYTVMVDNACGTATSNAIVVEVNAPPVHVLEAQDLSTCAGTTAEIIGVDQSGQADLLYQWTLNDAPIDGANTNSIEASIEGQYALEVSNPVTGCAYIADPLTLSVDVEPAAMIEANGSVDLCDGTTVDLAVVEVPGNTYQWYVDDMIIDEADGPTWQAAIAGSYTVVTTNADGCSAEPSDPIAVSVAPAPEVPGVISTEPTTFCEGGGVTLIADVVEDINYQWSNNGDEIDGAFSGQLTIVTSGTYTVAVSNTAGCQATSDPIEVIVNPLPDTPEILSEGVDLVVSGTGTYQWFLFGIAINGATDATYNPASNGSYTVQVTDENGCSATSEAFNWLTTGIEGTTARTLRIMPNPTTGNFVVEVPGGNGRVYEVLDATGKVVRSGRLEGTRSAVDLTGAGSGIYFLRVLTASGPEVHRVILTR